MKTPRHTVRLAAVAVALAGSMSLGIAAENILWTWNDPGVLGGWGTAWGPAVTSQDPLEDNTGNEGGSLYISTDYGAGDQNVVTVMGNYGGGLWNSGVLTNLLDYASLEFDIKWDATSTVSLESFNTAGGDNGLVIWNARHNGTDWEWIQFGSMLMPEAAATGWAHVSIPINPTTASLDRSAGIVFKKWIPAEVAAAGGVAAFWIDNVELVVRDTPVEPPTLSLSSRVSAGLNLITLAGGQWQRQGIRTVAEDFSWVGSGTPTTYEYTVSEMPEAAYAGFSTHIYLVARDPRTRVDPDWAHPDVVRFDMSLQADGTYLGTLRYKTDAPDSNGGMFGGDGELGSVSSSTSRGRWGFTFEDDSNITIFSPEETAEVAMPGTAVAKFDDALTVYFGCMANAFERLGQKAVLTQAQILGTVGGVDVTDDFGGPLNTTTWELAAEYPAGVMILGSDAVLWLGWTLPDGGFGLQSTSDIAGGAWAPFATAVPPLPTGATKSVLITQSNLPGANAGYWRLIERQFSKLQILLPGETAAPGTPTGKTGTPDPQAQYEPFQIRVNAVSDDWSLVSTATDAVTITTTDPDVVLPADATLVNGTVTLTIDLGTVGAQTITVSNVTNPAIASNTSSEVMITP